MHSPGKSNCYYLAGSSIKLARCGPNQKFLCGQDEGHWFVAAIPDDEPVSTVAGAQIALEPAEVRLREEALGPK